MPFRDLFVVIVLAFMGAVAGSLGTMACRAAGEQASGWALVSRELASVRGDLEHARIVYPGFAFEIGEALDSLTVVEAAVAKLEAGEDASCGAACVALDTALSSLVLIEEPWALAAGMALRRIRSSFPVPSPAPVLTEQP